MYNSDQIRAAVDIMIALRDELSKAGKSGCDLDTSAKWWIESANADKAWDSLADDIESLLKKTSHLCLTTQQAILTGLQLLYREQRVDWRKRVQITDELYIQNNAGDPLEELMHAETRDGVSIFIRRVKKDEEIVSPVYVPRIDLTEEPPLGLYDIKAVPRRENLPTWMEDVRLPTMYLVQATQFFHAQDGTLFAAY